MLSEQLDNQIQMCMEQIQKFQTHLQHLISIRNQARENQEQFTNC